MALDLDPSHLPTLAALRQIAIDARRLRQGGALPRSGAELHDGAARSARASSSSSASCATRCSATTRARCSPGRPRYEADPENEDAALPLVDEYIAQQEWAKAEPLLDLLVRKSGKRERSEQHALQNKLGQVCAALGQGRQGPQGLHGGAPARSHRPGDDPRPRRGVLPPEGLGRARSRTTRRCSPRSSEDETAARADVYYKLGCIKREQGQAKQAINNFEKALARRPGAPRRRSRRSSRSTRSSRTGSRSSPTSGRSSTTSSKATSASGCSTRSPTSGATRTRTRSRPSRRSRRRASCSRRTTGSSTSSSRSTRRPRTGRR